MREDLDQDSTVIENANLVAFLVLNGFIAIPFIIKEAVGHESSRVAWDVQGDIESTLKRYHANEKVGVKDFVRCLVDVRTQMYSQKQIKGQLKGK